MGEPRLGLFDVFVFLWKGRQTKVHLQRCRCAVHALLQGEALQLLVSFMAPRGKTPLLELLLVVALKCGWSDLRTVVLRISQQSLYKLSSIKISEEKNS